MRYVISLGNSSHHIRITCQPQVGFSENYAKAEVSNAKTFITPSFISRGRGA